MEEEEVKYIDAEALKAELSKAPVWTTLAVKEMIDKASGCVICKDCKHWCKGDDVYGICYRCPNTRQMRYDDFCSYGERQD